MYKCNKPAVADGLGQNTGRKNRVRVFECCEASPAQIEKPRTPSDPRET